MTAQIHSSAPNTDMGAGLSWQGLRALRQTASIIPLSHNFQTQRRVKTTTCFLRRITRRRVREQQLICMFISHMKTTALAIPEDERLACNSGWQHAMLCCYNSLFSLKKKEKTTTNKQEASRSAATLRLYSTRQRAADQGVGLASLPLCTLFPSAGLWITVVWGSWYGGAERWKRGRCRAEVG